MKRMTIDLVHRSMSPDEKRVLIASLLDALAPDDGSAGAGVTLIHIDMAQCGDPGDDALAACRYLPFSSHSAAR